MIEYLEYKGKKLPFAITMSTLVEFKKTKETDFEFSMAGDISNVFESVLTITILGLNKGFEMSNPSMLKVLWNYITTGKRIGIKNSEYVKIIDAEYAQIMELIPKFFTQLTETDKKK